MKKIQILLLSILLSSTALFAQKKEVITTEFQVSGVCGMCKERIENALGVKGVKFAEYNTDTHLCKVIYRSDKISEDRIHQLLNEAGHDTEKSKATEEQYNLVHECCHYREHDDH